MKHVWNQVRRASAKVSVSASVAATAAAGAVAVMAAPASAENRAGPFETEFEFDVIAPGAAAVNAAAFDVSSAAAKWEQSIGAYLDGLIDELTPAVEAPAVSEAPAQASAEAPAVDAVVAAEIEAFDAPDAAKPEVKPLPPEVLEALGIDPAEVADGKAQDVLIDGPAQAEVKAEVNAEVQAAVHVEPAANPLLLAPVLSHPMDCELCRAAGKWVEVSEMEPVAEPAEALVDDMVAWQKLAEWASARISGDEATQTDDDFGAADEDGFDLTAEDPTLAD